MDLKRILKVYNYVNDERRPKVNVKFIGLLAALLLAAGSLVAFAVFNPSSGGAPDSASTQEKKDFVGLTDVEVMLYGSDSTLIQQRMADWEQRHPDAQIVSQRPVYDERTGALRGYEITYRE